MHPRPSATWRFVRPRLLPAGAVLALALSGLATREIPGPVGDHGGTVVYGAMVYALVLVGGPRTRRHVAALVASAIGWDIEVFQLTLWPAQWAAHSLVSRLILGSTFNAVDLMWLPVGAAAAALAHLAASRVRARRRAAAPEAA